MQEQQNCLVEEKTLVLHHLFRKETEYEERGQHVGKQNEKPWTVNP